MCKEKNLGPRGLGVNDATHPQSLINGQHEEECLFIEQNREYMLMFWVPLLLQG